MAKAVKMKDIADKLNISVMTVSKALSGKPGVSEALRARIKELADEMGYIALESENKKSYNIGVLLAYYYTENCATFYWKLYQEINTRAVWENRFVLLEIVSEESEKDLSYPKMLRENKVDGVIILGAMSKPYLKMVEEKSKIPVVYMDFYEEEIPEDCVISNSFYGTWEITRYLLKKGHEDIAFVGTLFSTKSITDRYLGYEKAMLENGREIRKDWIIPDRDAARASLEEIPLPEKMPTAFVCNCDVTASRLIKELQDKGYRIPEDISVVGYDDYLYPGLCNVEITSYGVNMELMASTGIDILVRKIEETDYKGGLHVIPGYLVEKESVRELTE